MKLFYLSLLILLIPLTSSISTTMLPSYQPGETMIIEIQGNILGPIDRTDIVFKRAHVAIAVDYDVKRILDKYYLYAQVPVNQNNYTLFINDISTTVNGQNQIVDFNQTFEVNGNLTDYSINPGFITSNQDFSLIIKSNSDSSQTINLNFPDETALIINPGLNTVQFKINSINPGFYLANIGKYTVPIHITSQQQSSIEDFQIVTYPKIIREVLKIGNKKTYLISLTNNGNQTIDELLIVYNKDIFSLNNESISNLEVNSTSNFSLTLKNSESPISEKIIISKGNEILDEISIEITFTDNESEVTNSSNPEYYCSELGGKFCSALEVCSGQLIQSLDGSCCVGVCNLEEESSSSWIFYLLIIVVLVIIFIVYRKYKKSKPSTKTTEIKSLLKKPI